MFNKELTLDDFVSSIPICQPEADLGSILNVFQHYGGELVAIPQKNNGWGTINSRKLLALMAKLWQKQGVALAGHPRTIAQSENIAYPIAREFNRLIEPAIVLVANVKLQQFLIDLEDISSDHIEGEHLIVNELGKLRGKLNRAKILKYLASTTSNPQLNASNCGTANSFLGLIESASFPWKIETIIGEHIYSNQHWQKLVDTAEDTKKEQQLPDVAIAKWWIDRKYAEQNETEIDEEGVNPYQSQHCDTIMPVHISPTQTVSDLGITAPPPLFAKRSGSSNILCENISSEVQASQLEVKIERKQDWNYIKIPISSTNTSEFSSPDNSWYWLVLATKIPHCPPEQISETIISELLGIVSHELKSPLTGIIGLSSILKDRQLGELNQRQAFYTQLIHSSGHKLIGIVNDLIEITSLTQSKSQINLEPFSLQLLCRQVYEQCVTKLKKQNTVQSEHKVVDTQLRLEIEPELEIAIADKRNLSAILSHLVLETIHFAEDGNNTVVIKVENITTQPKDIKKTAITVSNGLIADSQFDLPTQNSFSRKQSSGWNLILAKYLGQLISGDIQSNYSINGCQLTLLLPLVTSETTRQPPKESQTVVETQPNKKQNLTILCLYPETDLISSTYKGQNDLNFNLKNWAEQDWSNISQQQPNYQHRIIEADGLEQAHTLARIWKLDVILLDGHQITDPEQYLRSLQESTYLAALPLITLDTRTTEAANQIEGLNVYPCLLPAQCRSIKDLLQVIQIATG